MLAMGTEEVPVEGMQGAGGFPSICSPQAEVRPQSSTGDTLVN